MNQRTERVFKGFLNLTPNEKSDLIDTLNNYYRETNTKQKELREQFNKRADLGPLSSNVCTCCGR